jgi:predicted ester cyclase
MYVSKSQITLIAHRAFEEIWNEGNLDAVDALYSDDFVEHGARPRVAAGRHSYKEWISAAVAGFPYECLTIKEFYCAGDKVAARYVVEGCLRNAGSTRSTGDDHRTVQGVVVMRISGGQIKEAWGTTRMLDLLGRCGSLKLGSGSTL